METLIVGDHFVSSSAFREAMERALGSNAGPLREVTWAGKDQEEHHAQQQIMERDGPEAVDTPSEIVEAVGDAEVIAVHFAPVPAAVIEAGSRLKAVIVARAGYENVNVETATAKGVAVVNIQGRNAEAVAEQAIGLMLAESRDIARADAGIKAGRWKVDRQGPTNELSRRTVGLVGFGYVARQLAKRLVGFSVRILAYDPYVDAITMRSYGVEKAPDLATVFREGDFVNLHARLTEETRRFIGREQFKLMKPTAYFINNARSRMVDYDALYEVLASGRIAGAGLDVFDDEPLKTDDPFRKLSNVTLVPHLAGVTEQMLQNSVDLVAEAAAEIQTTGRALNTVNASALDDAR
jgi:D-3-phosphoglycerate dehydrogenase / 2-oxoglutarate reductase